MKTIAIYHKDCNDGTTAAAIVLKKYPDALLFPLSYGYEPEEIAVVVAAAEKGDRILTVDCAMGAKEFLSAGYPVTVIDHHAGIEDETKNLAANNPALTFVFDNKKSGASGTWAHLFPDKPAPELVKYVEDLDLWNWKYGAESKAVNNFIFMLANKPEEVVKLLDTSLDQVKRDGGIISRYSDIMIDHDVKSTESIMVKIGQYLVPCYNITVLKSECGNILSKERAAAVGLFTINSHEVRISFRSLDAHTPSALDIAKSLNGGGHRNSAGAAMPLQDFLKAIVEEKG